VKRRTNPKRKTRDADDMAGSSSPPAKKASRVAARKAASPKKCIGLMKLPKRQYEALHWNDNPYEAPVLPQTQSKNDLSRSDSPT
jgi:hypothetical protein